MTLLPIRYSLSPLQETATPMPSLVNFTHPSCTTTTTFRPRSLHHRLTIPKREFPEPTWTTTDHKTEEDEKSRRVYIEDTGKLTWQEDMAAASIMWRLERVAERVIEMETKKFKGKIKGETLSDEETVLVEAMSREIVTKFLEEPIKFLRSSGGCSGDFQEKIKNLNFLVKILEENCSGKTIAGGKR